ncbi:MAG: division/cell wall cluster transcriptional repressor MraZ [Ruminococcaceae bacterium]|nr:division/cell wall cluster transcriptional repressor MraZ [Oscillospiraceae bacterium]
MYIGQYFHNLDAKGRVIMPSRFREQLGENFVVTEGYEGCLSVYSEEEWNQFVNQLLSLPTHSADTRRVIRRLASGAVNCETDKQGRILLPAHLRDMAKIEKEVMIIGAITRVEIWDSAAWEKYNNDENAMSLEEATARLSGLAGV